MGRAVSLVMAVLLGNEGGWREATSPSRRSREKAPPAWIIPADRPWMCREPASRPEGRPAGSEAER
ncbi:hypothetical protein ASF82_02115 [Frigoribacterium sp. Leaf164]|nr:hypothetical protein ASF82_02115 [Frigoribacterium sp. Leaf164]